VSKLEGRVAVVTGAASGIGAGIAVAFAREGADIVVADKASREAAADVIAAIVGHGREALYVRTDVSDEASVRAMADEAIARFGRVDILVNNAGIWGDLQGGFESILDTEPDYWDFVMGVNLKGAYLCSRAVVPKMREQGWGRIVNMSSIGSRMAGGVYGVSKLGLNQLTFATSNAVAESGITCNAVAPGPIWNEATQKQVPAEFFDQLIMPLHIKRPGTSTDMYGAIKWLCTDDAAWHTGQTMYVNGGFFSIF
jgi:3-oxoacyl-[acyl-carrier protein] reductase